MAWLEQGLSQLQPLPHHPQPPVRKGWIVIEAQALRHVNPTGEDVLLKLIEEMLTEHGVTGADGIRGPHSGPDVDDEEIPFLWTQFLLFCADKG